MIGRVVFTFQSRVIEAVMEDDGTWRCDAVPCLTRPLNILQGPSFGDVPLTRSRCLQCLEFAASWLNGEVRLHPGDRRSIRVDRPTGIDGRLEIRMIEVRDLSHGWMRLK
jgi:hypothetical protein